MPPGKLTTTSLYRGILTKVPRFGSPDSATPERVRDLIVLPAEIAVTTRMESPRLTCAFAAGVSITIDGGVPGADLRSWVGRRESHATTATMARMTTATRCVSDDFMR